MGRLNCGHPHAVGTRGPPGGMAVGLRRHAAAASIAEERPGKGPDVRWSAHPTRRLRIELTEALQLPVLLFRQKSNANLGGHFHCTALGLVLLPGCTGRRVVAGAPARSVVPQLGEGARVIAFTGHAALQEPQPVQSAAETSGEAPPPSLGTTRIAL